MQGRKPTPAIAAEFTPPPPPPEYLNDLAAAEWVRITTILASSRVLSPADEAALVIYCTSVAQYRRAQKFLDEEDLVVLGAKESQVKSPWVTVQNSAWNRIRPLLSEFGLTPTARGRLKTDGGDDAGDDLLD